MSVLVAQSAYHEQGLLSTPNRENYTDIVSSEISAKPESGAPTAPLLSLLQVSMVPTRSVRGPVRGALCALRHRNSAAKCAAELRAAKCAALAPAGFLGAPSAVSRAGLCACGRGVAPPARYVKQPPQTITDKRWSGYAGTDQEQT